MKPKPSIYQTIFLRKCKGCDMPTIVVNIGDTKNQCPVCKALNDISWKPTTHIIANATNGEFK